MRRHDTFLNIINDALIFHPDIYNYKNVAIKKDRPKTPKSLKEELKEKPVISIKILKRLTVNKRQKALKKPKSKQPQVKDEPEKSIKKLISPKIINIAQIGTVLFIQLIKKKDHELFAIIMRDINKYLKKEEKSLINPRDILPKEYHEFLNIFLKELINELPSYHPYNYKIELLIDPKNYIKNAPLYLILTEKLTIIKKYLKKNLNKGFITKSFILIISPILFIYKPDDRLRFYINYRKLNVIMKKDKYLIPLIKKIMAQLMKVR